MSYAEVVDDSALSSFFKEISALPLLSAEEERELGLRSAGGDAAAREHLYLANIRLVVYVAKHFRKTTVSLDDLIQEGCIGLMRAVEKFDPTRGVRFSTHAVWWIRQALQRATPDLEYAIRLPAYAFDDWRALKKMQAAHEGTNLTEIATLMGKNETYFEMLQRSMAQMISLESPIEGADHLFWKDTLEDLSSIDPQAHVESQERVSVLQRALADLPKREADILKRYFGLAPYYISQTMQEIALEYEVTKQRIQQLLRLAQAHLRALLKDQDI